MFENLEHHCISQSISKSLNSVIQKLFTDWDPLTQANDIPREKSGLTQACGDFYHLLITFTNSFDAYQDR